MTQRWKDWPQSPDNGVLTQPLLAKGPSKMDNNDVLMADILVLKNSVAALLQAMPDRAQLLEKMDRGARVIEATLLNSSVPEDFLKAVQTKLEETRRILGE